MHKKIVSLPEVVKKIAAARAKGKTIAFTNGCFDIVHAGHIKTFRAAKRAADIVVLGLNSDSSIRALKGSKRPILNQRARAQLLQSIEYIDYIVLFTAETPRALIKALAPDVLVKGGDWSAEHIAGREFAKKILRVAVAPGLSTTGIIKKIVDAYA